MLDSEETELLEALELLGLEELVTDPDTELLEVG